MKDIPKPIAQVVMTHVLRGRAVDVYKTASNLEHQLPELSFEEIVELIAEAVGQLKGAAIWEPQSE